MQSQPAARPGLDHLPPNLFLIGAPKCGTSALAAQLARHPDVFMAMKEPRFLDAAVFHDWSEDYPIRDADQYLRLYASREAQRARFRLDASVFVMYSESALLQALSVSPDAKFLLVLRDPLEASKSMHLQRLKYARGPMRELSESFAECWRLLDERREGRGFPDGCRNRMLFRYDLLYRYELYLPTLMRVVPRGRLLCIDYAVLRSDPSHVLRCVQRFLGLPPADVDSLEVNPSYILSTGASGRLLAMARRGAIPLVRWFPRVRPFFAGMARRLPGARAPGRIQPSVVDGAARGFFAESERAMRSALELFEVNQSVVCGNHGAFNPDA